MTTYDSARYQDPVYIPVTYGEFICWECRDIVEVLRITEEGVITVPMKYSRGGQPENQTTHAEQYWTFDPRDLSDFDKPLLKEGSWLYTASGRRYYRRGGFKERVWETSLTPPWIPWNERMDLYVWLDSNVDEVLSLFS